MHWHTTSYPFLQLLSVIFLILTSPSISGQTQEDLQTMRQYILENMTENSSRNSQLMEYYARSAPAGILPLKIRAQLMQGQYSSAAKSLYQLKELLSGSSSSYQLQFQYNWMGYLLTKRLGIRSEAMQYLGEIHRLKEAHDRNIQLELAISEEDFDDLDAPQRIRFFSEMIPVYENSDNIFMLSKIYSFLGKTFAEKGDPAIALHYYQKAEQVAIQNPDYRILPLYGMAGMSEYFIKKEQPQKAMELLLPLQKQISNVNDIQLKRDLYRNLAIAAAQSGNTDAASAANTLLLDIRQSDEDARAKGKATLVNLIEKDHLQQLDHQQKNWRWILGGVFVLFLLSAAALWAYRYRFLKKKSNKEKKELSETKNFMIPDRTEARLLQKLETFEKRHGFISKNISLKTLAAELDTNPRYLSEIINKNKHANFNTYINELRIAYIVRKLNSNSDYRKYKVSYLADECGFSSHSLFTTVFKNTMGLSPIEYIRQINSHN